MHAAEDDVFDVALLGGFAGKLEAIAGEVGEIDDGVLLNAAPLYLLTPAWKKADPKLDLSKVWKALKDGDFARYGQEIDLVGQALSQLNQLTGASPSASP